MATLKLRDDDYKRDNTVPYILHQIKRLVRECEEENLDFEDYIDKNCLYIVREQLECCLRNKEKLRRGLE